MIEEEKPMAREDVIELQDKSIKKLEDKAKRNLVGRGPVAPEHRYTI